MHNPELQRGCKRLFYNTVTGVVRGYSGGGGAVAENTGDDLIRATYAPLDGSDGAVGVGCIEEFYMPLIPGVKPTLVDLTKVHACIDAVAAHRAAVKAEADFVCETSLTTARAELPDAKALAHHLRVAEVLTRPLAAVMPDGLTDDEVREWRKTEANHALVLVLQGELQALSDECVTCCEALLTTRDAAVTFTRVGRMVDA